MRLEILILLVLLFGCKQSDTDSEDMSNSGSEMLIAFGSCNNQVQPQPLWSDIAQEEPDLWIWLGDNIYGDSPDMDVLRAKYAQQNSNSSYHSFKTNVPIIGVWDDHDYGINDGDRLFGPKAESQQLALDFLDVPLDAEVRQREGLYQSHEYMVEDILVRIILLDGRYFRDPLTKDTSGYVPDPTADILGNAQWNWLESELSKEEDVLIIGCGIQFIPEEHPFEKWANFPTSRNRLFDALDKENAEKIVLISGDRHIGEMSKIDVGNRIIHEVTSSGLTHSWETIGSEPNQHRIGRLTPNLNYGLIRIKHDKTVELILSGENRVRHMTLKI